MTEPVTIVIMGPPAGKGRPKFTRKGHAFTPEHTRAAEKQIAWTAKSEMGSRAPMEGPLMLNFRAIYVIPKSWPKQKQMDALLGRIRPTSKPDIDNVQKLLCDAMNGIVYRDDSQIVHVECDKRYGANPSIVATVKPIIGAVTDQISEDQSQERVA